MRIGLLTPAARSRTASWKSSTAKPSAAPSARAARSTPWPYAFALTTAHSLAPRDSVVALVLSCRVLVCRSCPARPRARVGLGGRPAPLLPRHPSPTPPPPPLSPRLLPPAGERGPPPRTQRNTPLSPPSPRH